MMDTGGTLRNSYLVLKYVLLAQWERSHPKFVRFRVLPEGIMFFVRCGGGVIGCSKDGVDAVYVGTRFSWQFHHLILVR